MGFRAIKIDTLNLSKELEESGIPKPQAEAQLKTTIKVIDMVIEEKVATKQDLTHAIDHLEEKITTKINHVEKKLSNLDDKLSTRMDKMDDRLTNLEKEMINVRHEIKSLSLTLTIKLGSFIFAGVLAIAALIKFLPGA